MRSANLFESDRSLGVRYDATSGPLSYGVAFHRVDTDFDDINSYSAAARYATGALTFAGGIEHLRGDSDNGHLGARRGRGGTMIPSAVIFMSTRVTAAWPQTG